MSDVEAIPKQQMLIGFQKLTSHGFARPVFGVAAHANVIYTAVCRPPGNVRGRIIGFKTLVTSLDEADSEKVVFLDPDHHKTVSLGDFCHLVMIWEDEFFVGRADEVWAATTTVRDAIAERAPLTFLALTELDPTGESEWKAVSAAHRWLRNKIGSSQAFAWYQDSFLRGAMVRLLRAEIPAEGVPTYLIEQELNKIQIRKQADGFAFYLPEFLYSILHAKLEKVAVAFENKTHQNLSFEAKSAEASSAKKPVQDTLVWHHELEKIISEATSVDRIGRTKIGEKDYEAQVMRRRQELTFVDREKDVRKWIALQLELGVALLNLGKTQFQPDALEQCIAVFKNVLDLRTGIKTPKIKAFAYTCIGEALKILGQWAGGWEKLATAVAAYRAALEQWSRDEAPLEWAAAQNDLGVALQTLGERDGNVERLHEAVAAYRAALEERKRERVPLLWASTQNSLGSALWRLGESDAKEALFLEAIFAYRSALEERTRRRGPLAWAMTQNNLGAVLARLGERQTGTELLKEAVVAFRSALEERTRDQVPFDWAMTQNNLGNALRIIGERENNISRLEEAIIAYRAALEEYTRDRVPLDWAMVQNNLGAAFQAMGKGGTDTAWLGEAITAYRAALEKRTRDRVPLDWAATQSNLGNALSLLGEHELGTTKLEEAVIAYRSALEESRRDRFPLEWAITTGNLAMVEELLGDKTKNPDHWRKALYLIEMALEEYRTANATFYINKGNDLRDNVIAKLSL